MKKSWFYPIIAGICDFYFTSLLLGAIVALGVAFFQTPINLIIGLAILLLALLITIGYHLFLAKQVQWLTPGELLVGRTLQDNEKVWTNPYGYNRWALFLIIILTLLVVGNSWDRLSEGYVYTIAEVAIRIGLIVLVSFGLIELGQGRIRGVIYPIFYFIFQAYQILRLPVPEVNHGEVQFFAMLLIGIALLHLVIAAIYGYLGRRDNGEAVQSSG